MHNRNILSLHVIHHNLPNLRIQSPIPQEQQIPPLESGLHGPGEYDDDGRRRVGDDGETFPEHEGSGEDECEVEHLRGKLPGLHVA